MALSPAPEVLAATAAIALFAAVCLSITAFGFALVMVPLLSLAWDVKSAVVTAIILATVTMIPLIYEARSSVPVRSAAPILTASLATIPVGLLVLNRIDPATLKILVAAVVMIAAVALYLSPTVRLDRPRLPISLLVGGLSGFLRATTATPGPPVVLYVLSYEKETQRFRGTILAIFLPSALITLAGLALTGFINRDVMVAVAVSLPGVAAGSALGFALRHRVSRRAFRMSVLFVLFGSSLGALVSAVI